MIKNRIVVKVGTSTITNESGAIDFRAIDNLCKVLAGVENNGYEVVLVSSGAIAVGANKMRLSKRPRDLKMKQAAAAVGQCELMHIYDKFFSEYNKIVAQILFNAEDIEDVKRRENLTNTLNTLLKNGILPIINENDSVSYAEIESDKKVFGDNDTLSAIVAGFCEASKLILLSDIEGLYDKDPRQNNDAKLIERVEKIDDDLRNTASGAGSNRGTGGMITKLSAAEIATEKGIDMYIIHGEKPKKIYDILDNKSAGTMFVGKNN